MKSNEVEIDITTRGQSDTVAHNTCPKCGRTFSITGDCEIIYCPSCGEKL